MKASDNENQAWRLRASERCLSSKVGLGSYTHSAKKGGGVNFEFT